MVKNNQFSTMNGLPFNIFSNPIPNRKVFSYSGFDAIGNLPEFNYLGTQQFDILSTQNGQLLIT